MIISVSTLGLDPRLLQASVAGRPFVEHLQVQFQTLAPASVHFVESEALATEDNVLAIAGGVWFSTAALREVLARADRTTGALEVRDDAGVVVRVRRSHGDATSVTIDARELDPAQPPVRVASLVDLARVERAILYERACTALRDGVWIRDPDTVAIRGELRCGVGVEIDRNVIIDGRVTLGDGVKVGANCILINATIGARSAVNAYSVVEGATIGANCFVGPYGRIRPGSTIGDAAQIGNFVEIKNSEVGTGSRINHLAFVGDATLHDRVTIGAGTITCNHDGIGVQRTDIGADAYVGSGSLLIAPVKIGEKATIAAGSTITDDAPAGKLTIARARQATVETWARPGKSIDGT